MLGSETVDAVEDHCAAIVLALQKGEAGAVYNIGGNSETTNIQLVRVLCKLVDQRLSDSQLRDRFPASPVFSGKQATQLISHVRDRPGHDRRYAINYSKAARDLGYWPARDLLTGLTDTVDWYLQHIDWWHDLLSRDYEVWLKKNYDG